MLRIKLDRTGYVPTKVKCKTKKVKALVLVLERVTILNLVTIKEKLFLLCLIREYCLMHSLLSVFHTNPKK